MIEHIPPEKENNQTLSGLNVYDESYLCVVCNKKKSKKIFLFTINTFVCDGCINDILLGVVL